ncbi:MAG: addiction module protein [Saprospiraceae bacterium]|nr:addiction module protein [Saprospiraceae bacterium]
MGIESLKKEASKLSRLEKLDFLQYIANLLAEEENVPLIEEHKSIILTRQQEVRKGEVKTIPASNVKSDLMKKYGLHD